MGLHGSNMEGPAEKDARLRDYFYFDTAGVAGSKPAPCTAFFL